MDFPFLSLILAKIYFSKMCQLAIFDSSRSIFLLRIINSLAGMSSPQTDFSNLQAKDLWPEVAHLAYSSLALNSIFELILYYFFLEINYSM